MKKHFDTLEYLEKLKESGMSEKTANALTKMNAKIFEEMIDDKDLATKEGVNKVSEKINQVDQRINQVEGKINHVDERINKVEDKINSLKTMLVYYIPAVLILAKVVFHFLKIT